MKSALSLAVFLMSLNSFAQTVQTGANISCSSADQNLKIELGPDYDYLPSDEIINVELEGTSFETGMESQLVYASDKGEAKVYKVSFAVGAGTTHEGHVICN